MSSGADAFEVALAALIAAHGVRTVAACDNNAPAWIAAGKDARAARVALLAAHAAAVAEAEARGQAFAYGALARMCDALAGADEHESIALWRIAPDRWRAEVADAGSCTVGVGLTAPGAICDLFDCDRTATDMAAHLDACATPERESAP